MAKARCPSCDAEALYVGLSHLECPTVDCPNYRPCEGDAPPQPEERQLTFEIDLAAYGLWTPASSSP